MRKSTTKSTTLKSLAKEPTVLKGKRVVKPDINPQATIDQAVKEAEQMDKEQALLERELQKPMKQRNKALLDKYNVLDSGKTLDNYPNLNRGVNYEMNIQFPEDDGVALEARPSLKEWYVGLRVSYKGNIFNYRFPIHYSTFHDGQQLYKLDGFPVYVDPAGTIRNDLSEYTIFQALTDYSQDDLSNGQVSEVFYRHGIITDEYIDADILSKEVPKNFAIKGVYVTSKAIKATEPTVVPEIKSSKELVHPFKVAEDIEIPADLQISYNVDLNKMKMEGGIVIPGLTKVLPNDILVLSSWSGIKTVTKSTPRFVFLSYDSKHPNNIFCHIILGSTEALRIAKTLDHGVKRTTLQDFMIENNKSVLNRYHNDIEAEKKRIEDLEKSKIKEEEQKKKDAEAKVAAEKAKEEKKKKEEEEKAKKKAADEEEKKKKEKEEAERKLKEKQEADEKYIDDTLIGKKQKNVMTTEDKPKRVLNGSDKDALNEMIDGVEAMVKENGLVIDGLKKDINRTLGNYISAYHASTGDNYPSYISLLARDDDPDGNPGVKTIIFMGFSSLKKYLKIDNVSDRDVADRVVKHNNSIIDGIPKTKK